MAGDEGFEPPNAGAKGRCLTTWRIPNGFNFPRTEEPLPKKCICTVAKRMAHHQPYKPGSVPDVLAAHLATAIYLRGRVHTQPASTVAAHGPTHLAGKYGLPRPVSPQCRVGSYPTISTLPAPCGRWRYAFCCDFRGARARLDFPTTLLDPARTFLSPCGKQLSRLLMSRSDLSRNRQKIEVTGIEHDHLNRFFRRQ